ncbi:MAG: hypothetical protein ACFNUN_09165 [Aggregatibacter sp.]|uniref:hypothetical protein n=1 Tax=Aggregatibacter sp. TaxID=1872413 RepID=UPI00362393C7
MFFKQDLQVVDGKKYIVIECQFRRDWDVVRESEKGVTQGEALEILQYWLKYKDIDRNQIMIIEVPDIVKRE